MREELTMKKRYYLIWTNQEEKEFETTKIGKEKSTSVERIKEGLCVRKKNYAKFKHKYKGKSKEEGK